MPTYLGTKRGTLRKSESFSDGKLTTTYDITLLVLLEDEATQEATTVLSTFGLPVIGSFWTGGDGIDVRAVCIDRTAEESEESPLLWEVPATFSSTGDKDTEEEKNKG